MNINPLISICIPSYNGAETISKTLDVIIPQLSEKFEIIICDDCSTDATLNIAENYQLKFNSIKVFKNNKNLGMDKNFHRTTQLASGKFIWFCGQDDLLEEGVLSQAVKMLTENIDIGILNLNFSQYDHNMVNCITPSYFDLCSFDKKKIRSNKELYFSTPEEYYNIFTQPPSFLPSVVMLREYWDMTNIDIFKGTYFIQVGVLLMNMHLKGIGVFTTPLIKGRIPDDQWQSDGNKLFSVMTGELKAKKIAFTSNSYLPFNIFERDKIRYVLNFIFMFYACKKKNMVMTNEKKSMVEFVFKDYPLSNLYLKLVMNSPIILLTAIYYPLVMVKKILFKFSSIRNLRY